MKCLGTMFFEQKACIFVQQMTSYAPYPFSFHDIYPRKN